MATLTIEVPDELVKEMGLEAIAARFQKDLELEHMRRLALKLDTAVREAGLDHDQLFKEARREAWKEFKAKNLSHIFTPDGKIRD